MAAPHRTNTAKTPEKVRPSFGLTELLANRKAPSLLLADIRGHVLEQARVSDRDAHVLHPSDICRTDWCPHAAVEKLRGRAVTPQRTSFRREAVFAYGHDAHARWQRWLAEMHLLEGTWLCQSRRERFYARAPHACAVCGGQDHLYEELALTDPELLIAGRTDGYIPDRAALVEVKTIGEGTIRHADPALLARHRVETPRGVITDFAGLWGAIHRPFTAHLKQGLLYVHLARVMGLPVERIGFIYDSKMTQDAKEFTVSYDKALIRPVLDAARAVKLAMDGDGPDPPCKAPGACKDCEALI